MAPSSRYGIDGKRQYPFGTFIDWLVVSHASAKIPIEIRNPIAYDSRRLFATVRRIRVHNPRCVRPQCHLLCFSILLSLHSAVSTLRIAKSENGERVGVARPVKNNVLFSRFGSVIEWRTMSNWMWCDLLRFPRFFPFVFFSTADCYRIRCDEHHSIVSRR